MAYYLGLLRDATSHPVVGDVLRPEHLPMLRSTVRAAALSVAVFGIWREALQRLAVAVTPPMSAVSAIGVSWVTLCLWSPSPPWTWVAAAATTGLVVGVVTLVALVVVARGALHVVVALALAACGMVTAAVTREPTSLIQILVAASLVPVAIYAAVVPMMIVAYVVAWRLGRFVDPRARVILGLLDCACDVASGRLERRGLAARVEVAAKLERTARALEHDLPRVIHRRAQDTDTRRWLRDEATRIAARIRSSKRLLALPEQDDDALLRELATMLLRACRDEWRWFSRDVTASRSPGLWIRIARRLGAASVLIAAGVLLPGLLDSTFTETTTDTLRTLLVISGVMLLLPLPRDTLSRIPDTFAPVGGV